MARVNARRLRQLREDMGYSQEELAQRAGLKSGTIYKMESGKNNNPGLQTLTAIAKVLGVSVIDLISEN